MKKTIFTSLITCLSFIFLSGQGLHVEQGNSNNSNGEGGYLWVGPKSGQHLSLDQNEIQARFDFGTTTLNINPRGGNVRILESGGSQNLYVDNSGLYYDNLLNRVGIGTLIPNAKLDVQGTVEVGIGGAGQDLLRFNSERPWVFRQIFSGASSALQLTGADPNNNNKHFIIQTDGFVGIRDDTPEHILSLGSDLARTKLALYEAPGNNETYGLGVTNSQFNFVLGNPGARYKFYNDDNTAIAVPVFEIWGDGRIEAPELRSIGSGSLTRNLTWHTSTGEIGIDNSSRRYKTNINTLEDDWRKILDVRPVQYNRPNVPDHIECGYIAEEMDSIGLTHLVGYDVEGRPDDVKYDRMVLYLTELVKQQHQLIEDLKADVTELVVWKQTSEQRDIDQNRQMEKAEAQKASGLNKVSTSASFR